MESTIKMPGKPQLLHYVVTGGEGGGGHSGGKSHISVGGIMLATVV